MIILESLEIENFRNIKHTKLKNLKHLNVLIGPNNCGKTNVLEFILSLGKLDCGGYSYPCEDCDRFKMKSRGRGLVLPLEYTDTYLRKRPEKIKVEAKILFNTETIDRLVPGVLKKQEELKKTAQCQHVKNEITMKGADSSTLEAAHFSPFIHKDIIDEIKKHILYCPEQRLQTYKDKDFKEYLRERKLSGAKFRRLIKFIGDIVDPAIHDHEYEDLIRKIGEEDFTTSINEQGSGVRSLICLVSDLISKEHARIILIDEPELGLNPLAKQEFFKLMLKLAEQKQIFISTQDPSFVNPVIWNDDRVSVYFHSLIDQKFVRIDLKQSRESPDVFAGYLPHTTSLKNIHIYVEGTSDVYIFQILMDKYLRQKFENWFQIKNKVGIYHLCGDFWKHLLYTIPKKPYRCIVILDGDKREVAEKICSIYNESAINTSKFAFSKSIEDLRKNFERDAHPIYCLKEKCIEKYLFKDFDYANPPENYNKTKDGPMAADKLREFPEEITKIFDIIFQRF